MEDLSELKQEISKARNELKNIRQMITTLKHVHVKDVMMLKDLLQSPGHGNRASLGPGASVGQVKDDTEQKASKEENKWRPIGYMKTVFKNKNGTPRQANVCGTSKGVLQLMKDIFTNPEHSLEDLDQYSHVWLIYEFHQNNNPGFTRAKVKPPRLDGAKVGLFSTRSPYRPNAIGLSLVKLDKIEGCVLHFTGVDVLDGTPIIDIKPYIPMYDQPGFLSEMTSDSKCFKHTTSDIDEEMDISCGVNNQSSIKKLKDSVMRDESSGNSSAVASSMAETLRYADWVQSPPIPKLTVVFNPRAEIDLDKLEHLSRSKDDAKQLIECILRADPRSSYRRQNCQDRLYYFTVDNMHVTCWFDENVAEVLRLKLDEKD